MLIYYIFLNDKCYFFLPLARKICMTLPCKHARTALWSSVWICLSAITPGTIHEQSVNIWQINKQIDLFQLFLISCTNYSNRIYLHTHDSQIGLIGDILDWRPNLGVHIISYIGIYCQVLLLLQSAVFTLPIQIIQVHISVLTPASEKQSH